MSAEPNAVEPFIDVNVELADRRDGKVRVSYALADDSIGGRRLFVTTDRLSAFDRVLAGIPFKGQVLNQLAAWWFERTDGVVANHLISTPDPNVTIGRTAEPLPVEVIVRGAITGVTSTSLWRQYEQGARTIYGYDFADGIEKNSLLPAPLITPTTKPPLGSDAHDEPLTCAQVVARGLVERDVWDEVTAAALDVFRLGQQVASDAGLLLADTKYEFGLTGDGSVVLIDEVHTPDSSRYWVADTYEQRLASGAEPESLDKEPFRIAVAATGYRGDGESPVIAPAVIAATTARYIDAYERITGRSFVPGIYPVADRIASDLDRIIA